MANKTYDDKWNCTYPNGEPEEVFPNHYGASYIRNVTLKEMETSFFTGSEQALINETTIYTDDTKNNSVYSTTDKLYFAYGDQEDYNHITVGKNSANDLNDGIGENLFLNYFGFVHHLLVMMIRMMEVMF